MRKIPVLLRDFYRSFFALRHRHHHRRYVILIVIVLLLVINFIFVIVIIIIIVLSLSFVNVSIIYYNIDYSYHLKPTKIILCLIKIR